MIKVILLFSLGLISLFQSSVIGASTLVVGSVSENPSEEIAKFLPFTRHLARQLAGHGVTDGKVVIARNLDEMSTMFLQGKVDLYIDSPISAYAVTQKTGGQLMLRRWKKGVADYHSVIFVRADSEFYELDDLLGHTLLFEKLFSSSGYLLPKMSLNQKGYLLRPQKRLDAPVARGEIGYYFSNDEENTLLWVYKGVAAAGAMGSSKLNQLSAEYKHDIRILHHTLSIPRHVVSHRKDIDPLLLDQIRRYLLHMHESPEGQKVLYGFEKTAKFDEIPTLFRNQLSDFSAVLDEELILK